MKLLQIIKQAIYPEHYSCLLCEKEIDYKGCDFCENCLKELPYINGKVCLRCGEPINLQSNYCINCKNTHHNFKKNISCFEYTEPISNLIINFKFNKAKYIGNAFSNFMVQKCVEENIIPEIIIPVPLHGSRLKERGFNQAELLAIPFAEKMKIPLVNNCIIRKKNTPKQSLLSTVERTENVKDAFEVIDKTAVKNKVILLVDDVYTTGATLSSCAEALHKAKAKEVYCITLAHAIKNKLI